MLEGHSEHLTRLEKERFDALARFDSIAHAAKALGLSPQTMYNWLYLLRKKYKKRRGWLNAVLSQRKRARLLRQALTEKRALEPMDEEDEEEAY